ncbi:neutral zinc metallopeptidase [Chryseobacterium sp. 09-1422]|jgi:predicted metalloprotease|uniref:Neutral zinc metallopeptidase n=1 Tax=Chryseobacterium kimseyorum TaxID=2984028 RepID=A0ABT3HVF3_9FLAO|nr:neutral zinc metallopeptidase [Chryseobacterium kimseyorum]MCW3167675.1 neutral zinc metallopeptidase [Chryseobacterium kimseyorum]
MKWTDDRSGNVDDRRGSGGGGGAIVGGGLGTIIIAAIVFFLGGDPSAILSSGGNSSPRTEQRELSQQELQVGEFVKMITAENEETWTKIFAENGMQYKPARVVLFREGTNSGCGQAQSAMGPFYCPADQSVYMDMSFFQELQEKFGAKVTEFTIAYVMAHEMGHHVQNLLGTLDKTDQLRKSGRYSETQLNQVSVATELQADFYAGLWARYSNEREKFLEPGDLESAVEAAEAVGDDNIQKRSQGYVNQESFTHGSSAQRKEWFMKGYNSGDIKQGDTFNQLLR